MTVEAVLISITIKVSKQEVKIEKEIRIEDMEGSIQGILQEAGVQALRMGIEEIDDQLAAKGPKC